MTKHVMKQLLKHLSRDPTVKIDESALLSTKMVIAWLISSKINVIVRCDMAISLVNHLKVRLGKNWSDALYRATPETIAPIFNLNIPWHAKEKAYNEKLILRALRVDLE